MVVREKPLRILNRHKSPTFCTNNPVGCTFWRILGSAHKSLRLLGKLSECNFWCTTIGYLHRHANRHQESTPNDVTGR